MTRILARLEKPGESIRVMRQGLDMREGYLAIRETDTDQHTESIPWMGLDLYLMMKNVVDGYKWLALCPTCHGEGWRWVPSNHGEDADRDLCPECQGRGGK